MRCDALVCDQYVHFLGAREVYLDLGRCITLAAIASAGTLLHARGCGEAI